MSNPKIMPPHIMFMLDIVVEDSPEYRQVVESACRARMQDIQGTPGVVQEIRDLAKESGEIAGMVRFVTMFMETFSQIDMNPRLLAVELVGGLLAYGMINDKKEEQG